ncbi:amidoligase family protein [Ruminococcus sp.]|uniref:amidoligase family protein n=1 Tax=Ruminococcus sp. TaxID=41978 RepID=UPI0039A23138
MSASIDPVRKNRSETYNMDEYRCELVTPILKSDKDMDDLQQIVRDLRKAGMRVNESCGLHVHIGAERQDAKSLTRLSNIMYQKRRYPLPRSKGPSKPCNAMVPQI